MGVATLDMEKMQLKAPSFVAKLFMLKHRSIWKISSAMDVCSSQPCRPCRESEADMEVFSQSANAWLPARVSLLAAPGKITVCYSIQAGCFGCFVCCDVANVAFVNSEALVETRI